MKRAIIYGIGLVCCATGALACGFHNYTPAPTMVDVLLASDRIVLARSTRGDPFRYAPTKALAGELEHVEIPHLVDSTTRRRLSTNPEAQVLFAQDSDYGPWQRLAYVDADLVPILETVMARLPDWQSGDDRDRFATFAALLNHPNPELHRLALRELDQADYGVLRSLALDIDTASMAARLNVITEFDLKPIRILLLGLSGNPAILDQLEAGVARNINSGGGALGAYATAMVELGGPGAARILAERYLAQSDLAAPSREVIAEALAIHSLDGSSEMQNAVRTAVGKALISDASLAPLVARQFGARYDWSQHATLKTILRSGSVRSPLDVITVSQYVALAEDAAPLKQD